MSSAPLQLCGLQDLRLTTTDASKSTTSLQPFRLLDLPLEIRLMIYELIVGGGQRIHIQNDLECMRGISVGQRISDGRRIKTDDLEEMRGSFSVRLQIS